MNVEFLRSHIEKYFFEKNFESLGEKAVRDIDLLLRRGNIEWAVALLADQTTMMGYLKTFEQGMQKLISFDQQDSATREKNAALAIAFESTLSGQTSSYRRALNKYSNSIVFEDLDIHLLLVRDDGRIEHVPPDEVNLFLGKLNSRIAEKKSRS